MNSKLKFVLFVTLIMSMSVIFSGCGESDVSVRVKQAVRKPLEAFAYANGVVDTEEMDEVYLDKGTKIDNVYVKVGDEVNQDQKLIQFNSDRLRQSNIDGVVTQVNIRRGMVVDTSNKPAIVIMDMTKLIIKADVKQSDITSVQQGQEVLIYGDSLPKERKITGKVESIARNATQSDTRPVFQVTVRIDGQVPEALKAGMNVSCDIRLSRLENALIITYESIKEIGNDKYVYVVKDGKLEERKVTIGASHNMDIEIKDGISEGDNVVIDPKPEFKSGMTATIVSGEK